MKYSDLSDFEINKLVAKYFLPCDYIFNEKESRVELAAYKDVMNYGMHDQVLKPYAEYNPCNNPSDAWPIIVENEIAIIPPVSNGTNGWKAERFYNENCGKLIDCIDKNPLRVAMIVFLMMNEGETK